MTRFEYKAIPAPIRTKKVKGAKTSEDRVAHLISEAINDMASHGWEFLRVDTFNAEDKAGMFKSRVKAQHTLLVFKRHMERADNSNLSSNTPSDDDNAPELGAASRTLHIS